MANAAQLVDSLVWSADDDSACWTQAAFLAATVLLKLIVVTICAYALALPRLELAWAAEHARFIKAARVAAWTARLEREHGHQISEIDAVERDSQ